MEVPPELVEELLETAQDLGIQGLSGEEPTFTDFTADPLVPDTLVVSEQGQGFNMPETQKPEQEQGMPRPPTKMPEQEVNIQDPEPESEACLVDQKIMTEMLNADDALTVDKMTEESVMQLFSNTSEVQKQLGQASSKNCGTCRNCRDMVMFGGKNVRKQSCMVRKLSRARDARRVIKTETPDDVLEDNPAGKEAEVPPKAVEEPVQKPKNQCQVCGKQFVKLVRGENGSSVRGSRFSEQEVAEHMDCHRPTVLNVAGFTSLQTRHEKPFLCDHCKNGYNLEEELKSHVTEVHKKKPEFMCQFCTRNFPQKVNMETHMKNLHFEAWAKWKVTLMTSKRSAVVRQ